MTPTAEDWQTFASILVIIPLLAGAVLGLRRMGFMRANVDTSGTASHTRLESRVEKVESSAGGLREDVTRHGHLLTTVEKSMIGIREDAGKHDQRIRSLETAFPSLATRDDLAALRLLLEQQGGDVREIKTILDGTKSATDTLTRTVAVLNEHLLNGKIT